MKFETTHQEHYLKTWPEYFEMVFEGYKDWELRKDDRNFKKLDIIILQEWDNDKQQYTGREVRAIICYILRDAKQFGLENGYCILSLRVIGFNDKSF